ncbi:uncharacterized protein LOC130089165 [Rhinichthys klamathensis goyatoka]|uniref:uncharacterized protein LOC130089165 n=1 Tax=Rhinichthys klamathensis goyatoka TaxID=3034132 RepID=UPI0024B5D2B5|nr:uncharacterized protein LOC130089165 [Rhinichthys klamathensis goyatoka]
MVFLGLFSNNPERLERSTASFGVLHFCFALIGLQKLMDREFSCPCSPGFNMTLISFIFLGPVFLALAVMIFIQRPCRRSSSHCAGLFLLCLIPPSLWVFLLLFEGEYVACGMVHWEGDYILDEELQIKWCKPTGLKDAGVNATDLRELTEKLIFYSRFSALVLLVSLSVVVIAAVSCWDCRTRCLEHQEKQDKLKQLSELSVVYGSEVELQRSV